MLNDKNDSVFLSGFRGSMCFPGNWQLYLR